MLKADKENIFAVCAIALCFALTFGLAVILSGGGVLKAANFNVENDDRYAIAVGGYTDMTLARSSARLIQSRGGAGYIFAADDNIEIIYAVYPSKELCQNALDKLGDGSAYIKTIPISKSKLKWADKYKDDVVAALKYYDLAFDCLYTLADSLNGDKITVDDVKVKISVLHHQIEDIKYVFYQNTADCDLPQITEVKVALITAIALIDNVSFGGAAQTMSSLRYQLAQLVLCYQALMTAI